jgi:hypothetical protein
MVAGWASANRHRGVCIGAVGNPYEGSSDRLAWRDMYRMVVNRVTNRYNSPYLLSDLKQRQFSDSCNPS